MDPQLNSLYNDFIKWIDDNNVKLNNYSYKPRISTDQRHIRSYIRNIIEAATINEIHHLADKLLEKNSTFLTMLMSQYDNLQLKHQIAILNMIAKRKSDSLQVWMRKPITLNYEVLSKLTNRRRFKILYFYYTRSTTKFDLTFDELDKLLFPLMSTHISTIKDIRSRIVRLILRADKNVEYYRELYLKEMMKKCKKDDEFLFNVLNNGIDKVTHLYIDDLENKLHDLGAINLDRPSNEPSACMTKNLENSKQKM